MIDLNKESSFDRQKIYEKLDYEPEPSGYQQVIPWTVQQQVAATNGVHYIDRIGKLKGYPAFELPVEQVKGNKIMLDIGCGWGRWVTGAAKKGYIPVGIDLRQEFCVTARQTLAQQGFSGYTLVADLKNLPFKPNVFDLVWSFSVIQHTHQKRLLACLQHIYRILKPNGFTKLEFPNKNGIRNKRGPARKFAAEAADYNSWCVRYYTPDEYKTMMQPVFGNFKYTVHSLLGIGILKEDLRYVSFKNKLIVLLSLFGTGLSKLLPFLKRYADSIYVEMIAQKTALQTSEHAVENFLQAHAKDKYNNLNIFHLLQCPINGAELVLSEDKLFLINEGLALKYPVVDSIPILVASQAISL